MKKLLLIIIMAFADISVQAQYVEEDFNTLLKKAQAGNIDAMCKVANYYQYGFSKVSVDEAEAFRWWKKAAEWGNWNAMSELGIYYYNGEGTTKNVNEAVRWWLTAGESGEESDEAEYLLGLCYWNGEGGLQKSYKEAVKWWQKAARHDHPEAKNALKKLDETW